MIDPRDRLAAGADAVGCPLTAEQIDRLMVYLQLLRKWNRTFNLVARADAGEIVTRHLLDSLSIVPWVEGPRILDLGSGAGLPGIPLAIALPEWHFTLLDSRGKRTAFLEQARVAVPVPNVEIVQARAGDHAEASFDTVVVRAFGTLGAICRASSHLLAPEGTIVAMKGKLDPKELAGIPAEFTLRAEREVIVPGVRGKHGVAILARQA